MPGPEPGQQWGILGGVFDPVHRGHLTLAEDMRVNCKLDGVLFIPADKTPHRQLNQGASFAQRCRMLELALETRPAFRLDRIEREADLSGYTLDTVRELKKRYPKALFRFIIGADNLAGFKTWHRWEELLEETGFLVGQRPGAERPDVEVFPGGRFEIVAARQVELSSTEVREAVRAGVSLKELSEIVPEKVARYILEERLYS